MKHLFAFLFLLTGLFAAAQPEEVQVTEPPADEPLIFAEEMPEFPGGQSALNAFIIKKLKYPKKARKEGIEGRVIVSFVVLQNGKVTDVKVVKSAHPILDKAAVDVVKKMPRWKPGQQRGKPVKVRYMLPIVFKIQ